MESAELEETELVVQEKDKYVENIKTSLPPQVYIQLIKLLGYLNTLPFKIRINHIDKLRRFEPIAHMNMKIVSLVILYYQEYGVGTTQENLNLFLEPKYKELLLETTSTLDVDKKLTPEFKRNVKINFGSYWEKLKRWL